jgi:hypothetical protein
MMLPKILKINSGRRVLEIIYLFLQTNIVKTITTKIANHMKKIALVFVLAMAVMVGFAQKNVRQTASNFLKDGKLDKALESINQCILDPSTAQDAKAWMIRGNVYMEIANTKDPNFQALEKNPMQMALDSYKKAIEFDPKKDYFEEIFAKLNVERNKFFDQAAENFNKKNYTEAMNNFEKAAQALSITNIPDTASLFYAAASASMAEKRDKAKQFYIELIRANAKSVSIYSTLADFYRQEKDSSNALKVIRAGKKIHPNDLQLVIAEANVYNSFNDVPKALETLNLASTKDTSNYFIFNALGANYQKIYEDTTKNESLRKEAFVKGEKAYKNAIRLKSTFYDAYINISSLYFNSAVPLSLKANGLPLEQKELYDKLTAEANNFYKMALPYLEKSDELQPNDLNTLNSLRQIYTSLGDKEKTKAIQEKIIQARKK